MVKAKFHQYRVVGRGLPTETDEHPKIYRMKLWATNEVRAKSKFWYFLRKLKKVKKSNARASDSTAIQQSTFWQSQLPIRPTAPFEPRRKIEYRVNTEVVIRSFDFPEENINCILDLSTVLSSKAIVDDCLVTSHLQIPLYQLPNQGSILSNIADAFLLELTAAAVTVSTSAKGPKMCIKKAGIKRLRRLQKKGTHYHQEERKLSKGTKFVRFTPKLL
ncbi:hypothetical protein KIW84_058078 [Lathyrus oleraceus]|uniref:60S ribosomal protein L18a n=1 Tax=Pisum sativum TaxID=3888 RepID=A0A9D5APS8_PEA|nr:hypothetical protein KIW84_058078 [Pisum sativum]